MAGFDYDANLAYAYKSTFWMNETSTLMAVAGLNRTGSVDDVLAVLPDMPITLNVLCADTSGRAAYVHCGWYRVPASGADPRLPVWGMGEYEWAHLRTFDDLPKLADPAQGCLVNANNKPVYWWDNGDQGWWESTHRVADAMAAVEAALPAALDALASVAELVYAHGTYAQVIEAAPGMQHAENILPRGQSGFADSSGDASPHFDAQAGLYNPWQRKPFVSFHDSDGDGLGDGEEVRDLDLATPGLQNPHDPRVSEAREGEAEAGGEQEQEGEEDTETPPGRCGGMAATPRKNGLAAPWLAPLAGFLMAARLRRRRGPEPRRGRRAGPEIRDVSRWKSNSCWKKRGIAAIVVIRRTGYGSQGRSGLWRCACVRGAWTDVPRSARDRGMMSHTWEPGTNA